MNDLIGDDGAGRTKRMRVDYPANSKRSKETPPEREVIEKVVTTEVIQRKSGVGGKFFRTFLAEDSRSVMSYVVMEVLLPAAKNMVSDAVSQGVERVLFGDARPRPAGRQGYTNYTSRFGRGGVTTTGSEYRRPEMSRQARATHDFNDIIISSRAEAEDVLDRLRDLINSYEVATVSDLYDLVGLTGEFTDDKWGWYDLRSAQVRAIRGGYLLHLPRTQPIA